MNPIKELRTATGMTQKAFAEYFGISKRAIESWEGGQRECPTYLIELMKHKIEGETKMKDHLINEMETYLENMCAYLATGNKDLFRYYAGKADAMRDVLVEQFNWDEDTANEHIKAMWDIMDENW